VTDNPTTSIDFGLISDIQTKVNDLKNIVQHEIVDIFLNEKQWKPLEQPGDRQGPFGSFGEGGVVFKTALSSRTAITQGAQSLAGALDYASQALGTLLTNFHDVDNYNKADMEGKSAQLPNFAAPAGQARPGL